MSRSRKVLKAIKEHYGLKGYITDKKAREQGYVSKNDYIEKLYDDLKTYRKKRTFANRKKQAKYIELADYLKKKEKTIEDVRNKNMRRYAGVVSVNYKYKLQTDGRTYPLDGSWYYKTDSYEYDITCHVHEYDKEFKKQESTFQQTTSNRLNEESPIAEYKIIDVSHTKNEIRKPERPLDKIRMKEIHSFLLDGDKPNVWDRKMGTCVFDYIMATYGNIRGCKKSMSSMEKLNEVFMDKDELEGECLQHDAIEHGVSTEQIEVLCRRHGIPMYAVDENDKCFRVYNPQKRNHNVPALIFRVLNNHFYPISCKNHQRSIIQIASAIKCESQVNYKKKYCAEDEFEGVLEYVETEDTRQFLIDKIKETNKLPFPFRNIQFDGKDIINFKLEGTKYMLNQNADMCKTLCFNTGKEFTGQNLSTLLFELVEDVLGKDHEIPKSWANPHVYDSLTREEVKSRVHYGRTNGYTTEGIMNAYVEGRTQCCDINKQYTSCMYSPFDDWILLDFNDEWQEFDGNFDLGLYYVRTEDTTLLHKNNIYSNTILQYAKKHNIDFEVVAQLKSSNNLSKKFFKPIIDKFVEVSRGDTAISKQLCNMLSGMMGRHMKTKHTININSNYEQVMNWFQRSATQRKRVIIDEIDMHKTDKYFMYGVATDTLLCQNNLPIYIQIKDFANIRLHRMIKEMGGTLAFRKTDCAITINGMYPTISEEWGGYKKAQPPHHLGEEDYSHKSWRGFKFAPQWKYADVNDSTDWEKITPLIESGQGVLITGEAGTGKSYAIRNICNKVQGIKRLAPTHKACLVLTNAQTIDGFLRLGKDGKINGKWAKEIKNKYHTICIDEISMIGKEKWKILVELKRMTGMTFVLVGDSRQCKPIEDEGDRKYFDHPAVKYLVNNNKVELKVVHRYDDKLKQMLNNLENIDITKISKQENTMNICYYNGTRKWINNACNIKYMTSDACFMPADKTDNHTQDVWIHVGLPVISRRNKDGFINNEEYTVVECTESNIKCMSTRADDDGQPIEYFVEIPIDNFHHYFLMAYCVTIHKIQGTTLTQSFTIWDWDDMVKLKERELQYTALSRAKSTNQISFGDYSLPDDYTVVQYLAGQKIKGHLDYDLNNGFNNDTNWVNKFVKPSDVVRLYRRQHGCCAWCLCNLKVSNYTANDPDQLTIDRLDDNKGHVKGNIVISCWGCNRNHFKTTSVDADYF